MIKKLLTASTVVALLTSPALAEDRVSIGTGGTGGAFYAVGAGMADLLTKKLDGVTANAEVTGASIENVRRVSAGEMTIGFSSASTLFAGKNAQAPFDESQNVAAIAMLYPAVLQVAATKASGATSIADLADLKISVGPPGSNSSVLSTRLLQAHDAFNMDNISFLSYGEATGAIKNGNLDGSLILSGTPASAFIELSTTTDVTILPVDPVAVEGLLKEFPFYQLTEIPAGLYKGTDVAVSAIGDPAILFASEDADPELIYQITKTLFDNLDTLGQVHPAAKKISMDWAFNTPIELHEGARRYFDEHQ
ncbi:TAXI family TRAP transporter solute-binding subunit [Roseibium algae]|uniref:TAXI family TRAP transporter solute-binding subunit n=1 Tax=Roseibium algae TaxID=3123038 RepID=A0ABU8TFM9_9HYPH